MNGAEALTQAAVDAGVDVCFANPGTTEMHLVDALDRVPGMRAVLGLFEGVCTGAADGYGRMAGRPAMTLLHLGPGLANGLANLHNARRARTPVVNVVGDHATWHLDADAPLTSDIVSLASPMSSWVHTSKSAQQLAADAADAVAAAVGPPGGVATLIVPADCAWEDADATRVDRLSAQPLVPDPVAVAEAVTAVRSGRTTLLYIGGASLSEAGQLAAARVSEATGCRVVHETFVARHERGAGRPHLPRLAYFPEMAQAELADVETIVLCGVAEPVGFFGYRDGPSRLTPEGARRIVLARPDVDLPAALEAVAEGLGAGPWSGADRPPPEAPEGPLDVMALGQAIAAVIPEGGIVVEEAATSGLGFPEPSAGAPPHTVLQLTGGAIGQGLPTAVGAAVACPDRPVIAFQADGSAMYTLQSLWTMAREDLDVTVVICANRKYAILQFELFRSGVAEPGPQAQALTDLERPSISWVSLGEGLGVPSVQVHDAEALVRELRDSVGSPGPRLIEAVL